jgi:RNA polymerase sigma-70 factor (ECF subfamily)
VSVRGLKLPRRQCLLRRAQSDPDAFAEFYDAYAERVLVFFTRRVGRAEVAFDLLSETFAKALEHRASFRGSLPEEEQGWLFAIARSELSHYFRRGAVERAALKRLGIEPPALSAAEIERIEEQAALEEVRPRLAEALEALPADQRDAVGLRVVQELGYADIAARLGVTEEVVRARVSRGLRALRGEMA